MYEYDLKKVQEGLHKIDNAIALTILNNPNLDDPSINLMGLYKYKVKNPYKDFKFARELKTKIVTSSQVTRDYMEVFQQSLKNLKKEKIQFALESVKETTPLENFLLFINGYDSLVKKEETENVN